MRLAVATRAATIGITVFLAALVLVRMSGAPRWAMGVAALVAAVATALFLLRLRGMASLPRVALWVEERTPSLRYALVTVAEGVKDPRLETQALSAPWWADASRTLLRSLVAPLLALLVTGGIAVWSHSAFAPTFSNEPTLATAAASMDVLATVHVAVTPPAYAGRAAMSTDDPTSVDALIGSVITVSGSGDARLLTAEADSSPRAVAQRGAGWSVSLAMPARPALLHLHSSAGRDRLIVLAPAMDAVPVVTLIAPSRDTIVRRASGVLALNAEVRDDIGLRDASFELVISSGGGESFTFRTTTLARTVFASRTEATLATRLSLDSLALKPGDLLQVRAVARDGNTVTGPGVGASETRSIRVARPDEYDSLSVEAAPPPDEDAQVLSQRMLINLTEALVRRQRQLVRPMLVAESRRIASDQQRLRKRVGDVIFQRIGAQPLAEEGSEESRGGKLTPEELLRLADSVTGGAGAVMDVEGDETPILALNKPLLEAFNAMWDAGRALEIGEPRNALPPMRVALAAIERARVAERIYLRGRTKGAIVDVARVRLSGKDKGTPPLRETRLPHDPVSRRRAEAFERVTPLMATHPDAAADSLLLMRVDALGDAPALAAALDDAAKALRKHDQHGIALAWTRVRRALGGAPRVRAGISSWSGAP